MTSTMRKLVSKQKRRYVNKELGFDLDLSYITPKIVAMGFPSEDSERFYRNPYSEVIRWLNMFHKDRFKIYNLCSERVYDHAKFYGRVGYYPFDDHNAPVFELIEELCRDVEEFLAKDDENVAVIHCKAGKGRTGCMICCWLLWNKEWETSPEAQSYYAAMRTYNQKGVTIPSQIRYINYFEKRVKMESWNPDYKAIGLKAIVLNGIPKIPHTSELKLTLFMDKKAFNPWKPTEQEKENYRKAKKTKGDSNTNFKIECGSFPVIRDVKVQLDEKRLTSQEVLCTFWFNTYFILNDENSPGHLHLEQPEIDKANKDKNGKFPKKFSIDVFFDTSLVVEKEKEEESDGEPEYVVSGAPPPPPFSGPSSQFSSFTLLDREGDEDAVPKTVEPLNKRGEAWDKEARHPCGVVIELLERMIALYRFCMPHKQVCVTSNLAPKRHGDREREMFAEIEQATAELQKVSLEELNEEDMPLFWLNLVNLLYLHSFIIFGPPNNRTTREKILEKACYEIGGQLFSIVLVEHILLTGNLPKPYPQEIGGLKLPKIKLKEKDPRKAFMVKNPTPAFYFGIAGGARCYPHLFVFRSPVTLLDDLKSLVRIGVSDYFDQAKGGKLVLPVVVSFYKKNFGRKDAEIVENLAQMAGINTPSFSSVSYEAVDWGFSYFFLHYNKGITLEEAWALLKELDKEKEEDEKDAKKAGLVAMMDEIDDELEDDAEHPTQQYLGSQPKQPNFYEKNPPPPLSSSDPIPPPPEPSKSASGPAPSPLKNLPEENPLASSASMASLPSKKPKMSRKLSTSQKRRKSTSLSSSASPKERKSRSKRRDGSTSPRKRSRSPSRSRQGPDGKKAQGVDRRSSPRPLVPVLPPPSASSPKLGASPLTPPRSISPSQTTEPKIVRGTCDVCEELSAVYCRTCAVYLCHSHLASEHSSLILRKHVLVRFDEEEKKEEKESGEEREDRKKAPSFSSPLPPPLSKEELKAEEELSKEELPRDEEPKVEEPVDEESPKKEEPKDEEPEPKDEGPTSIDEQPVNEPVDEGPVPTDEEPMHEEVTQEPVIEEPVVEEPKDQEPEPIDEEPEPEPVVEQPKAVEQPLNGELVDEGAEPIDEGPINEDEMPQQNPAQMNGRKEQKEEGTVVDRAQKFGVRLAPKPEEPALLRVVDQEEEKRSRASTMEQLKPRNVGKKWGVNLRSAEEDE